MFKRAKVSCLVNNGKIIMTCRTNIITALLPHPYYMFTNKVITLTLT